MREILERIESGLVTERRSRSAGQRRKDKLSRKDRHGRSRERYDAVIEHLFDVVKFEDFDKLFRPGPQEIYAEFDDVRPEKSGKFEVHYKYEYNDEEEIDDADFLRADRPDETSVEVRGILSGEPSADGLHVDVRMEWSVRVDGDNCLNYDDDDVFEEEDTFQLKRLSEIKNTGQFRSLMLGVLFLIDEPKFGDYSELRREYRY